MEATLIGTSDIDTSNMNKDLMAVEEDLHNLIKKSNKLSEMEKSKVNR